MFVNPLDGDLAFGLSECSQVHNVRLVVDHSRPPNNPLGTWLSVVAIVQRLITDAKNTGLPLKHLSLYTELDKLS